MNLGSPLLHNQWVTGSADSDRVFIFLHGAFGQGRNLMNIAKMIGERCERFGTLLVDVREHGQSINLPGEPTMQQAAQDIADLVKALGIGGHYVVGHSMGGKIAGVYAGSKPEGLFEVHIIDTPISPSGPAGEAFDMLARLDKLPGEFESRQAGAAALQSEGLSAPIANWMAQNLVAKDDVYAWRFDLEKMRALIEDFSQADLWPIVESAAPPLRIIRATQSKAISDDDWQRFETSASNDERLSAIEVQGSHWLNVSNPQRLFEALAVYE